jgi:arylsulfatase A-like enzyme
MEAGTIPHDFVSVGREQSDWSTMTAEERAKSARSMEAYAGMVDRMDYNIGRVLEHLKASGEYDNTYIFFMSDNGAEGASYEARDVIREDILDHIDKYYDNSLENIGRKNSFVWYGNRWAQAATAPGRLYKMFSTQGGCRVPLVLKPAVGDGGGKITDAFCTVMDIVPTLLEVADVEHPKQWKGKDVLPIRGKSWTSFLKKPQLDDPFETPWTTTMGALRYPAGSRRDERSEQREARRLRYYAQTLGAIQERGWRGRLERRIQQRL